MALTTAQEKFCLEYSKTGNAAAAYRYAGYKAKDERSAASGASRLLQNANIKERLKEIHDMTVNDSIASIQEIKEFWTKVMRNEETEQCVFGSETGPLKITKDCSLRDRIKAAELLGKTAGIFIENVNVMGNVPITFVDDLDG